MARQKSAPKPAASKKAPRPPSSTHYGRTAILLEQMQADFRAVAEGQAVLRDEVFRSLHTLEERIGERFATLEFAVRDGISRIVAHDVMLKAMDSKLDEHTRVLGEHTRVLGEHTRVLGEHTRILGEHTRILGEHTRVLDSHTKKLDEHTRRHDEALERLDDQARTLADHSARLDRIEAKLDRKADADELGRLSDRVTTLERAAAGS